MSSGVDSRTTRRTRRVSIGGSAANGRNNNATPRYLEPIGESMDPLIESSLSPGHYRVRSKGFFKVGRVLVLYWAEPAGDTASVQDPSARIGPDHTNIRTRNGTIHHKARRFVIVKVYDQHCIALAIRTRTGRGVADHTEIDQCGIIYTGDLPELANDEGPADSMQEPILVHADQPVDGLHQRSRLDYRKVYTIEHNVPARAFGMVEKTQRELLVAQFTAVLQRNLQATVAPTARPVVAAVPRDAPAQRPDVDIITLLADRLQIARPDMSSADARARATEHIRLLASQREDHHREVVEEGDEEEDEEQEEDEDEEEDEGTSSGDSDDE